MLSSFSMGPGGPSPNPPRLLRAWNKNRSTEICVQNIFRPGRSRGTLAQTPKISQQEKISHAHITSITIPSQEVHGSQMFMAVFP